MAEESKFSRIVEENKKNSSTSSAEKDQLFQQIRDTINLSKNQRADKESSIRMMESFISTIEKNNSDLLKDLANEDKKLLENVLGEITKLQNKTLDEFKKSLSEINQMAEKLFARSQTGGPEQFEQISKDLQEAVLKERFKAEGLTLEGKDDTAINRLKQQLFGISKEPGREGKPVQGVKESFTNFKSDFKESFMQTFAPKGTFLGNILTSQESRREKIRSETERSNVFNAQMEKIKKQFSEVLARDDKKTTDNKDTQQAEVGGNAPDNDSSKEVDGRIYSSSANESAQNIEGASRSAKDEMRAGITDADPQYSRSGTVTGDKDRWDELLDLLKEIRDCVCECQCAGNQPEPSPTIPPITPSPTRSPQTTVEQVPNNSSETVSTATKIGLGAAAATGAVALLTRGRVRNPAMLTRMVDKFKAFGSRLRGNATATSRPLALPAPAVVNASPRSLPAPATIVSGNTGTRALPAPNAMNNPTLEQLGLKTAAREKVAVNRAGPTTPAEKTIAQRFYNNEISAREAAQQMRIQNRTNNITNNSNTIATAEKVVDSRPSPTGRWTGDVPKSQYFDRIKANQAQEDFARAAKTANSAGAGKVAPTAANSAGTGGVAAGKVAPTAAKAGGVLSKVSSMGSRVGGKLLGPLGAALDFGARKAEGQGTAKAAIGAGAGLAGAAGGAVIGQMLIPIPIVGAAIGGIVGGLLGGKVADTATDIAGMRESGGPVSPNGSYIVGEKGPELFTPNTAGSITNNAETKNLIETGGNNASSAIQNVTNDAKSAEAPVINVPPPTVIQQPVPMNNNKSNDILQGLPPDSVRTLDSSWQRYQNRRMFG